MFKVTAVLSGDNGQPVEVVWSSRVDALGVILACSQIMGHKETAPIFTEKLLSVRIDSVE